MFAAGHSPIDTIWTDESIAELVADTMHDHHDMDVGFADHARHIVAALRAAGVLADAPIDIDGARLEIARISGLARTAFGDNFHFATVTIWGRDHRQRHAAISVTLHIHHGSKSFPGENPAEAIAGAERYIREHDPAAVEAAGWATLGVERVA